MKHTAGNKSEIQAVRPGALRQNLAARLARNFGTLILTFAFATSLPSFGQVVVCDQEHLTLALSCLISPTQCRQPASSPSGRTPVAPAEPGFSERLRNLDEMGVRRLTALRIGSPRASEREGPG